MPSCILNDSSLRDNSFILSLSFHISLYSRLTLETLLHYYMIVVSTGRDKLEFIGKILKDYVGDSEALTTFYIGSQSNKVMITIIMCAGHIKIALHVLSKFQMCYLIFGAFYFKSCHVVLNNYLQ